MNWIKFMQYKDIVEENNSLLIKKLDDANIVKQYTDVLKEKSNEKKHIANIKLYINSLVKDDDLYTKFEKISDNALELDNGMIYKFSYNGISVFEKTLENSDKSKAIFVGLTVLGNYAKC